MANEQNQSGNRDYSGQFQQNDQNRGQQGGPQSSGFGQQAQQDQLSGIGSEQRQQGGAQDGLGSQQQQAGQGLGGSQQGQQGGQQQQGQSGVADQLGQPGRQGQQGGQQQQFDAQGGGQQGGGAGDSRFADQIQPHQAVVDANGKQVGTVDHVDGDQIKLARSDSPDGEHHYVPLTQVAGIEGGQVRLRERGDNDFGQEA